jgi:hypothetical protein
MASSRLAAANVITQNNIDNTVVRLGYTYVGAGAKPAPMPKVQVLAKASAGPMVSTALLVLEQEPHECSRYRTMALCVP